MTAFCLKRAAKQQKKKFFKNINKRKRFIKKMFNISLRYNVILQQFVQFQRQRWFVLYMETTVLK